MPRKYQTSMVGVIPLASIQRTIMAVARSADQRVAKGRERKDCVAVHCYVEGRRNNYENGFEPECGGEKRKGLARK